MSFFITIDQYHQSNSNKCSCPSVSKSRVYPSRFTMWGTIGFIWIKRIKYLQPISFRGSLGNNKAKHIAIHIKNNTKCFLYSQHRYWEYLGWRVGKSWLAILINIPASCLPHLSVWLHFTIQLWYCQMSNTTTNQETKSSSDRSSFLQDFLQNYTCLLIRQ